LAGRHHGSGDAQESNSGGVVRGKCCKRFVKACEADVDGSN